MQMGRDGLVISLREAGFFGSGSATPKPEALPTLRQIAASLGRSALRPSHRGPHRQCSHPHRGIRFQLGAFLGPRHAHRPHLSRPQAMPPNRLSAAGYAEFHPVAVNDTPEGRAENRRVDLVVLPRSSVDLSAPNLSASNLPHSAGGWHRITDKN